MASSYTVSWAGLFGGPEKSETIEITYVITTHTDGTITAISTDTDKIADGRTYTELIRGRSFRMIEVFPTVGGTAPDAGAVTVKDSDGLDLLGGNGATLIHATAKQVQYPLIDDLGSTIAVRGALSTDISGEDAKTIHLTIRLIFE